MSGEAWGYILGGLIVAIVTAGSHFAVYRWLARRPR